MAAEHAKQDAGKTFSDRVDILQKLTYNGRNLCQQFCLQRAADIVTFVMTIHALLLQVALHACGLGMFNSCQGMLYSYQGKA